MLSCTGWPGQRWGGGTWTQRPSSEHSNILLLTDPWSILRPHLLSPERHPGQVTICLRQNGFLQAPAGLICEPACLWPEGCALLAEMASLADGWELFDYNLKVNPAPSMHAHKVSTLASSHDDREGETVDLTLTLSRQVFIKQLLY